LISTATPCSAQGRRHSLDIDFVTRPPQELPLGHVSQDSGVGIGDSAEDALGLRFAVELETTVETGHDKVECV
jgi:hypothetical protein